MIKCDKGNIEISGNALQMLSELTSLVHSMYHNILIDKCDATPEQAKKDILEAVESGFKTEEEMKDHAKQKVKDVLTELSDLLKDILSGKDDE